MGFTMNALIAGSTGAIGSLLLRELINHNEFSEIIAITRRPLDISSDKLKEIKINSLKELKTTPAINNLDVVFCCLGTTIKIAGSREAFQKVDCEGVQILADLAERSHCQRFIMVSAAGANKNSAIFYNRIKGLAEDELRKRKIDHITIFRPGLLLTSRSEFRLGEKIAIQGVGLLKKIFPGPWTASFATEASQLVKCMIAAATAKTSGRKIIESSQILFTR